MSGDRAPAWMTDARDAWLEEATQWIDENVDSLRSVTSIRERPWGAVLRVETSDRLVFFKAEGPGALHEPVVVADIAATHPHLVPELLAADHDRAWLLMSDHGSAMWDSVDPPGEVDIWAEIFPVYGDMQRVSAMKVERWIAAGVPDRRLHVLPALVDDLLATGKVPLTAEQRRGIEAALPGLARVCDELADSKFAQAIEHSDMHGGNVLVGRGAPRLVDWGDTCITHPFASPFVTYQHAVAKLPAADRPAATLRLRDAYLEAWSDCAPVGDLREAFEKATWLGYPIRALNFVHQLGGPTEWGEDVAKFFVRWQEQSGLLGNGDDLILAVANRLE